MKRTFIIISAVVIVLLLLAIGYFAIVGGGSNTSSNPIVSGFRSFFPFGGNNVTPTPQGETPTPTPTPNSSGSQNFTLKLRELSSEPVAGFGTFDKTSGTVVRFMEKATGHMSDIELFSPNQNRVSNTTLPLAYDAQWGSANTALLARSLEDDNTSVDTYGLTLKTVSTSTESTVIGTKFPTNITDSSVFGTSVFYLVDNGSSSSGFVSLFDGSKKKQIWSSALREWNSQFVNALTVSLTSRPAQNVPGFMYFVNTGSGATQKILGDVPGLSTLTDGALGQVLYLLEDNGAILSVLNVKTNLAKQVTPVTFPEKCVWSVKDKNVFFCAVPREALDGGSLTSWYKGLVSFTDDIWKYDVKNNTASIVDNLSVDSGQSIDVIKPTLSAKEDYLVFINKIDGSLWSLNLLK